MYIHTAHAIILPVYYWECHRKGPNVYDIKRSYDILPETILAMPRLMKHTFCRMVNICATINS